MAKTQTNTNTTPHRRYQQGVAKRLDTIQAAVEDLRAAVQCVLAEREAQQKEQRHVS